MKARPRRASRRQGRQCRAISRTPRRSWAEQHERDQMGSKDILSSRSIRDDYVPKDDYLSREFAQLEAEYLWPKIWLNACRVEEIPEPGDFVTFDIARDSVIVMRGKDGSLKAFHNACPHR